MSLRKSQLRKTTQDDLTSSPRIEYGHMAKVGVICGAGDGTKLGTGLARMTNAKIPWTVGCDEVLPVLEGEVTVRTPSGDLTAGPRESIWLPAGTELTYLAENALIFHAIHPVDRADPA